MYFTKGKQRAFELLMQQKPGFDRYQSGCAGDFPFVYRREEPQPNRRISEKRANPYPHFLHERPGTGNV